MHPEIRQNALGKCPECGMDLVPESKVETSASHNEGVDIQNSYFPLILILLMIALTTSVLAVKDLYIGRFSWPVSMNNFMAGFFLVFSGFKFLDIRGFAQGYSTYDLLAKRLFSYGYIYPFIELILGLLYAVHLDSPILHISTFVIMGFSGLGVAIKLFRREKFQCACLGTFLKVPLTKITLVEDFGMAMMALLTFLL